MDVHHHSHAHGKRTWKSYFWEFTMLFLAVFCGFLAEYSLEHKIEKERGRQFIESFYEDLKTDTARISIYTNYDDQKLRGLDSLGACYEAITRNTNDASCLLEIIKNSSINRPFMRTDRTLKQLANAGGFRLLKKEDADSILAYDVTFNNFQDFQSTVFQAIQDNVRNSFNSIINYKANEQMLKVQEGRMISVESFDSTTIVEPILLSPDKKALNKYSHYYYYYFLTLIPF